MPLTFQCVLHCISSAVIFVYTSVLGMCKGWCNASNLWLACSSPLDMQWHLAQAPGYHCLCHYCFYPLHLLCPIAHALTFQLLRRYMSLDSTRSSPTGANLFVCIVLCVLLCA
jgi:hypothetical protein